MVFPRLGVLVSARRLRIACFGAIAVVSVAFGGCSSEETQPIDDGTVSGNRRPPNNNGRTDDPFDDTGTSGTNVGSSSNGGSGENTSSGENGSGGNASSGGSSNGGNPNGKAYGEPCEEDADCQSGLCNRLKVSTDGLRCSKECQSAADCAPYNQSFFPQCGEETDRYDEPRADPTQKSCRMSE